MARNDVTVMPESSIDCLAPSCDWTDGNCLPHFSWQLRRWPSVVENLRANAADNFHFRVTLMVEAVGAFAYVQEALG